MKKIFAVTIPVLLIIIILLGYTQSVSSSLSQNIVRLHVIANSDSDEDQALKLKVRNAILKHSEANFTVKDDVKSNLDIYRGIALRVISENGFDYDVSVEYGNFSFPTKYYENLALPEGRYDAVRVVIGSGSGKNWWCVLFPPLCYVNGTTDASGAEAKLRKLLSRGDYDMITAKSDGGSVPVEIKFKLVEFYGKMRSGSKVYAKARKDKTNENEIKSAPHGKAGSVRKSDT